MVRSSDYGLCSHLIAAIFISDFAAIRLAVSSERWDSDYVTHRSKNQLPPSIGNGKPRSPVPVHETPLNTSAHVASVIIHNDCSCRTYYLTC